MHDFRDAVALGFAGEVGDDRPGEQTADRRREEEDPLAGESERRRASFKEQLLNPEDEPDKEDRTQACPGTDDERGPQQFRRLRRLEPVEQVRWNEPLLEATHRASQPTPAAGPSAEPRYGGAADMPCLVNPWRAPRSPAGSKAFPGGSTISPCGRRSFWRRQALARRRSRRGSASRTIAGLLWVEQDPELVSVHPAGAGLTNLKRPMALCHTGDGVGRHTFPPQGYCHPPPQVVAWVNWLAASISVTELTTGLGDDFIRKRYQEIASGYFSRLELTLATKLTTGCGCSCMDSAGPIMAPCAGLKKGLGSRDCGCAPDS